MTPGVRKLTLTVHLATSLGWLGAVVAYVGLGIAAVTSAEGDVARAAWIAMEVVGWYVIVPLALLALVGGVVISVGTPWGLFRHYWVVLSLALTVFANVILLQHMPTVSAMAEMARRSPDVQLRGGMGGDLGHAIGGLVVLLTITVLNVYKPQGLTRYGWRKQQEDRAKRRAASGA